MGSVIKTSTVEQAKELIETNPLLIILDVRTELEFQSEHIEDMINIPVDDFRTDLENYG